MFPFDNHTTIVKFDSSTAQTHAVSVNLRRAAYYLQSPYVETRQTRARGGIRTPDLSDVNRRLWPLSYTRIVIVKVPSCLALV